MIDKHELRVILTFIKPNPDWATIYSFFESELNMIVLGRKQEINQISFMSYKTELEFEQFLLYFENNTPFLAEKLKRIYISSSKKSPGINLNKDYLNLWDIFNKQPLVSNRDILVSQVGAYNHQVVHDTRLYNNSIMPVKELNPMREIVVGFLYSVNGVWEYYYINVCSTPLQDKVICDFYINSITSTISELYVYDYMLNCHLKIFGQYDLEKILISKIP